MKQQKHNVILSLQYNFVIGNYMTLKNTVGMYQY